MSKAPSLVVILKAFLGDKDAALSLVADALHSAIVTMAAHGTRAPVDDACALIQSLKGKTTNEKAMRAGLFAIVVTPQAFAAGTVKTCELIGLNAGKHAGDAAPVLADDIVAVFMAAAGEILTAPKVTYAKPGAADTAARALKALGALTDAQVTAALRTTVGADFAARVARIAAVSTAAADVAQAAKAAQASKDVAAAALLKASKAGTPAPVLATA